MKKKSLNELGLTNETMFDVKRAMPYWLQLGGQEFLMAITHELKEQAISSDFYLKLLSDDPEISSQPVAYYSNQKTVKDVCEFIKYRNDRLLAILDVVWEYASSAMEKDDYD